MIVITIYNSRITWMNGGNNDRAQVYVSRKQCLTNDKYVDGRVGSIMRMMMRGGCLTVSGSNRMSWKCDSMRCVCGDVESENHLLLDCNLYVDVRRRWKEKMNAEHIDMYEAIKGYECIENETMC